jgi:hypothetical protein
LGFTSDLAFLPEAGLGISVLTNGQATNYFNETVRIRLFELVFGLEPEAETQADFVYDMLRKEFVKPVADLVPVEIAAVEPFLGRYTNPALGQIELRLEGDALLLDAGEFQVELRAKLDDDGEVVAYVMDGPPLIGLPMSVTQGTDGAPQIVLGEGVIAYTFTWAE